MAIGDVFEVTDVQSFRGQQVINLYFYEERAIFGSTYPTTSELIANNWNDQILTPLLDLQSGELTHTEIRVRNLFDASDAFTLYAARTGNWNSGVDTDTFSTFTAVGFALAPANPAVGKGQRRLAGIPEYVADDGVITDSVYLAALANTETLFTQAITVGTIIQDDVFFPVVVQRVRTGTAGAYVYSLPTAQGQTLVSSIASVLLKVLLTSQVSRKIGYGA